VAILRDGIEYEELTGNAEVEVVLDVTPFYAEGGGQIGDCGELLEAGGGSPLMTVEDTQRPVGAQGGGLIVHRGRLHGRIRVGETVSAVVDGERRARTMRNHTGTHLLHRALRNVVGERARQAGSLVTPDYLRFDFPLDRGLSADEVAAIEAEVRRIIRDARTVTPSVTTMDEAIAAGADAFFDEKYGERVRTVRVDGYSHELCGGTHCSNSGQVGGFVITGERSIGSGMRRIEALTGDGADAWYASRVATLDKAAETVGAQSVEAVPERIAALQEELREARRRLKAGGGGAIPRPAELVAQAVEVAPGVRLIAFAGPYPSIDAVKAAAKELRGLFPSGVIALALDADEPQLFVSVSDDLVARGIAAGKLVQAAVATIDGRGGGSPAMAQGKGTKREGIPAALAAAQATLEASG
jgi:alanyl-tRNA synthetase